MPAGWRQPGGLGDAIIAIGRAVAARQIGQPGGHGAGLLDVRGDDRQVVGLQPAGACARLHDHTAPQQVAHTRRGGRGQTRVTRPGQRLDQVDRELR